MSALLRLRPYPGDRRAARAALPARGVHRRDVEASPLDHDFPALRADRRLGVLHLGRVAEIHIVQAALAGDLAGLQQRPRRRRGQSIELVLGNEPQEVQRAPATTRGIPRRVLPSRLGDSRRNRRPKDDRRLVRQVSEEAVVYQSLDLLTADSCKSETSLGHNA